MNIIDRIDMFLNEKKFDLSKIKVEKDARTKEVIISYDGSSFYIPMDKFDTIKFVSKDGKIDTSTSIALANKKLTKFFTKDGIEYLKSEFKKIKSKGLTGENVYMHFHKK